MKGPIKLNSSLQRQITTDWHTCLPSLGVHRPRWLLRRVGPILEGILLERDSGGDVYMPTFHLHFLGRRCETVHLMPSCQLRSERSGGPDFIDLRWHADKYKEAAERMIRQSPLALVGDLKLDAVLQAYQQYLETPIGHRTAAHLYADMILLNAWAGRKSAGLALLAEALQTITEERGFQHVGGREQFETDMRNAIQNPQTVRATVEEQIHALGVADLPVSQLLS